MRNRQEKGNESYVAGMFETMLTAALCVTRVNAAVTQNYVAGCGGHAVCFRRGKQLG